MLGCPSEKKDDSLKSLTPVPLPKLEGGAARSDAGDDRESAYRVAPAAVHGEPLPEGAKRIALEGELKSLDGVADKSVVLLAPKPDVYLAQAAALFAWLDDHQVETWLLHPNGQVAYRLALRDEPAFQEWLDEAVPGKIRVIQRSDGFELQTNVGKLPGGDPNGPTVPLRGGQQDLATLRRGLTKLKTERFKDAPDVCWLPSFGTELSHVAESMSSAYAEGGDALYELCLVYPRPKK